MSNNLKIFLIYFTCVTTTRKKSFDLQRNIAISVIRWFWIQFVISEKFLFSLPNSSKSVHKTIATVDNFSEVFGNLRVISGTLSLAIFGIPRTAVGSRLESSYFFRNLCNLRSTFLATVYRYLFLSLSQIVETGCK